MSDRRTELGFERTVCDCSACKINCKFIPGFLLPSDIRRIVYSDNKVSNLTIKFQTQASKGGQDQPGPEHNPTTPSPGIHKSSLHKY